MRDPSKVPFIKSVFHPSDFSLASQHAFAHALAISTRRQTALTMLHVADQAPAPDVWDDFPAVRETLEQWGLLEEGSPRSAVFEKLGIDVRKIIVRSNDATDGIVEYLQEEEADLIVLATEGRQGVSRWLQPSLAEQWARRTRMMSLFVPAGSRGFVSLQSGTISLRRILVPVDHKPDPGLAVVGAMRSAELFAEDPVEVVILHAGDERRAPAIDPPESPLCRWKTESRKGEVVQQILAAADDHEPDLIIMTTEGRNGILDALRGSVTEQVVRGAHCPLLAVPQD